MKKDPKGSVRVPERDLLVTEPQVRALIAGFGNHGIVEVTRGFGRDKNTPHAVHGRVYRQLVVAGWITPHQSRAPFKGEVIVTESGKPGFLTPAGEELARRLICLRADAKVATLEPG